MKIKKLSISNFKGVRSFVLDAGGADLNVYAENAVGKTTLADAFYWCLFGKDSRGRTDFDIKPLVADGSVCHNLDSVVELTLDDITFRRCYHEVWERKSGSVTKEFTGHRIDFTVSEPFVVPPDHRVFSDPNYFASLHWRARREILMAAFCADVTDDVVIASKPVLEELPDLLGKHSPEDLKKIIQAQQKNLLFEKDAIPARIDEANRSMPAAVEIPAGVDKARAALDKAHKRRSTALFGGGAAEFQSEIALCDAEIVRCETEQRRRWDEANAETIRRRSAMANEIADVEAQAKRLSDGIMSDQRCLERMANDLVIRRKTVFELNNEEFGGGQVCPSCGQSLPEDLVAEARAKHNEQKAARVAKATAEGKRVRAEHDALKDSIAARCAEMADLGDKLSRLLEQMGATTPPAPFLVDVLAPDYEAVTDRRNSHRQELGRIQESQADRVAEIDAEIAELQASIDAAARAEQVATQRAATEKRIAELMDRERACATEYEELARRLHLLEEFVRAKVALVSERINSHFSLARFRLFDEQVNRAVVECCDITHDGVPWGSLNNGARVNVGLEILDTLTQAMGADPMPIFIDNAESVCDIRPTAGQQIRLIVSRGDKTLRVEKLKVEN